jgi:hypothetical protein
VVDCCTTCVFAQSETSKPVAGLCSRAAVNASILKARAFICAAGETAKPVQGRCDMSCVTGAQVSAAATGCTLRGLADSLATTAVCAEGAKPNFGPCTRSCRFARPTRPATAPATACQGVGQIWLGGGERFAKFELSAADLTLTATENASDSDTTLRVAKCVTAAKFVRRIRVANDDAVSLRR